VTAPADPSAAARRWRELRALTVRFIAVVAVIVALWYGAAFLVRALEDTAAARKLPFPHDVALYIAAFPQTFLDAGWATGSRAVIGFFVGLIVGVLFAVLMVQSRWIESAFIPYVLAMQMIPLIALVPILRAVLRDPDLVRLYVTGYVSFFIVTIAVLRGLKNAAPTAIELMDSINASRWKTLRYLRFPAALPYIFTGLRVAAPLSLIGAILVDFLGARNGLGYLMVASLSIGSSQSEVLWAALLISMAIGLLFTGAVIAIERRVSFWQPAYRTETAEAA
jgi:NitT/TauT family transport system permease protein